MIWRRTLKEYLAGAALVPDTAVRDALAYISHLEAERVRLGAELARVTTMCEGTMTRLAETREALHEWRCPSCGATTRARMADAPTQEGP